MKNKGVSEENPHTHTSHIIQQNIQTGNVVLHTMYQKYDKSRIYYTCMTLASLRIVLPFTLLCMLFIPLVQGQEIASCEDGEFLTLKETGLECSALPVSEGSSRATSDKTCNSNQFLNHNGTEWACISFPNPPAPPTLSDFVDIDETIGGGICESDKFLTLAIVEDELKLQCAKPPSRESGIPDGGTAGQVLTKSAKLKSVWADVESAGASLLSLLPVERTYVAFPSFSANDVTLVGGNTRINIDDATEFNEGDWVVIKQSGESNEKAIERGSVARVVNNEGKTTFQNWSADFARREGNVISYAYNENYAGQLNKDATSATNYGSAETEVVFLGQNSTNKRLIFNPKGEGEYVPLEIQKLHFTLSTSPTNFVSFVLTRDKSYDTHITSRRFSDLSTTKGKDFIEANHQQRIFVQTSHPCDCVVLAGDHKSEIQNQNDVVLIKTRLGENAQESLIPNSGVEGQVLTKTAESFAWAKAGFNSYDLLSLILAGKRSISFPSFSASDVSLVDSNTRINIDDTTKFDVGDWIVVKQTGESDEEAKKRGSVTRVVISKETTIQNYSADFDGQPLSGNITRYAFTKHEFNNGSLGALNKNAISATNYGSAETKVVFIGQITTDRSLVYNPVAGVVPLEPQTLNVTLSTSPSNSVSLVLTRDKSKDSTATHRFFESGTTIGRDFIDSNHHQRIFVQISYTCDCVVIEGDFVSQIQNQNNVTLIKSQNSVARTEDTIFQNYSAEFEYDRGNRRYAYDRRPGVTEYGQLNTNAAGAQNYGGADTKVTFLGISSNAYLPLFILWIKPGYIPSSTSHLNVTLSTFIGNSVSFKMEKYYLTNATAVERFKEINTTVAKAFITANHNERIFVQISYP